MQETIVSEDKEIQTKKVPKWRNLAFDKQGKSFRGRLLHPTKESAIARHKHAIENFTHIDFLDGQLAVKDI